MYKARYKFFSFFGEKKTIALLVLTLFAVLSSSIREIRESFHESLCHSTLTKVEVPMSDSNGASLFNGDLNSPNKDQQNGSQKCQECGLAHSCRGCASFVSLGFSSHRILGLRVRESVYAQRKMLASRFFSQPFRPPIA